MLQKCNIIVIQGQKKKYTYRNALSVSDKNVNKKSLETQENTAIDILKIHY